uniref:Putative salivary kunitz domain protein n=1 Tax=Ixodes ricinus TaxID=34613 RepID=A0A0K8RB08_IXORI
MQRNILWIFVVAACGVCQCDDSTDDSSKDDSSLSTEGGGCGGPPYDPPGRMYQKGWFFDQNRGECRHFHFSNNYWEEGKNKFQTLQKCRKTCRSDVPPYCFLTPKEDKRTRGFPMFSYNSKKECALI